MEGGESLCSSSAAKYARRHLTQAIRKMIQYGQRLGSKPARRSMPSELRTELMAAGDAIETDLRSLRGNLRCPDDALGALSPRQRPEADGPRASCATGSDAHHPPPHGFSPHPGRREAWLMKEGRRVPARRLLVTLNATSPPHGVKPNAAQGPAPLAPAKE